MNKYKKATVLDKTVIFTTSHTYSTMYTQHTHTHTYTHTLCACVYNSYTCTHKGLAYNNYEDSHKSSYFF